MASRARSRRRFRSSMSRLTVQRYAIEARRSARTCSPDATLFELSKSQGTQGILKLLIAAHEELADFAALLREASSEEMPQRVGEREGDGRDRDVFVRAEALSVARWLRGGARARADRSQVFSHAALFAPVCEVKGRPGVLLVDRVHSRTACNESANEIEAARPGSDVQRRRGPWRQRQRSLERGAIVDGLAVRDDHALEWEGEHVAQSRERTLLMPLRRPHAQNPGTFSEAVRENDGALLW